MTIHGSICRCSYEERIRKLQSRLAELSRRHHSQRDIYEFAALRQHIASLSGKMNQLLPCSSPDRCGVTGASTVGAAGVIGRTLSASDLRTRMFRDVDAVRWMAQRLREAEFPFSRS
jgi:hypothetical protein